MEIPKSKSNNFKAHESLSPNVIRFYDPEDSWGWLANFSPHRIIIRNRGWQTVEHFFQAEKFAGGTLESEIERAESPAKAKALAKLWQRRKRLDWERVRLSIMYEAVRAKFSQHRELQKLLLSTGSAILVEDSEEDDFWGQDKQGLGLNMMGQLLIKLRAELSSSERHGFSAESTF